MEEQKTFGSIGKARRVRRGIVAAATVATALSSSLALAVPAGATSSLTAPGNATIVGAGSATTYDVMVKMGTLFNAAPSCDLYQPSTAASAVTPQDFTCVVDSNPSQTSPAINGASVANTPANPFGDVALQEPPVGSSVGIKILSNQGAKGAAGVTSGGVAINVANNVTFARSSRNLKSTDYKGLNFVAFARDGVSWSHYTKVEDAKGKAYNQHDFSTYIYNLQPYSPKVTGRQSISGLVLPVTHWTPHNLRRTASTMLSSLGCVKEYREAILGHVQPGVEGIYNAYSYDAERVEWLKKLSDRMQSLMPK